VSETCRSDAAYVLGALSPVDRRAYEEHLHGCADCQSSVQQLAGVPGLLSLTTADGVDDPGPPLLDTLLPGLVAGARSARRRRHWAVGGALAASVAAVVALAAVLVVREADEPYADRAAVTGSVSPPPGPATSGPATTGPTAAVPNETQDMQVVLPGPMTASLELVDKKWGTAITVICHYDQGVDSSVAYDLAVVDTDGNLGPAGTWRAVPGATSRVTAATAVPRDRIASLEVRLPDGRIVLRSAP